MNEYRIKKTENVPVNWEDIEGVGVITVPWKEHPLVINTLAKLTYNDEKIFVRLETEETDIRAMQTEDNSQVCEDSCMEFFFRPNISDKRYFNFEINPLGTLHLGIGKDRYDRKKISFDRSMFKIKTYVLNTGWVAEFEIPFDFINKFTGFTETCYGNFYKCGELTDHEHYCVWNLVETEKPDYHQFRYFGRFIFE